MRTVRTATGDVVSCLEVSYLGHPFLYPETSEVGAAIARGWDWDHVLRPIVDGVLPLPNPTICEVGSNIGASVLEMLAVRPRARVTCYEPSDRYRAVLEHNLSAAGFDGSNVSVRDCIVDRNAGTRHIYTDDTSGSIRPGGHLTRTQVADAVRLDDAFVGRAEPLQLLKTDTDGNDLEVLRGAESLLAEDRPVLFVEFCPELIATDPVADLQWLQGLGYKQLVCLDHLGFHVGTTSDAAQATEWSSDLGYCDILAGVEGTEFSARISGLRLNRREEPPG
ncbi:MAG TPA: FkbM family methyltransferase [Aeromicrobium sp.]|nr:FkbM family methyltransferase [Aeromicrobium sp.]